MQGFYVEAVNRTHLRPPERRVQTDTAEAAPFDTDDFLQRCMGQVEFAQKIIAQFQQQFESEFDALQDKVAEGDAESVRSMSHRLKGTTATVSAVRLKDCLAELEALGASGNTEAMSECLANLQEEWSYFSTFVDSCFD